MDRVASIEALPHALRLTISASLESPSDQERIEPISSMTTEARVLRTSTSSDEVGLPEAKRLLVQTSDKGTQRPLMIPQCWTRWSVFDAEGAIGSPIASGRFMIDGDHTKGLYDAVIDYLRSACGVLTLTVVSSQEYFVNQLNNWPMLKERGFRKSDRKPYADREAMLSLDGILIERGIRIVARMPEGDEDLELERLKEYPLWSAENDEESQPA